MITGERITQRDHAIRKSFTPSERVAVAKAIEEQIGKRQGQRTDREPRQNIGEVSPGEKTSKVAAQKAGFGNPETYRQAKKVTESGTPELVEAMDKGEVSISAAAAVAELPVERQREAGNLRARDAIATANDFAPLQLVWWVRYISLGGSGELAPISAHDSHLLGVSRNTYELKNVRASCALRYPAWLSLGVRQFQAFFNGLIHSVKDNNMTVLDGPAYTIQQLADYWGIEFYRVRYALQRTRIEAAHRIGIIRVFSQAQIPEIKAAVERSTGLKLKPLPVPGAVQ